MNKKKFTTFLMILVLVMSMSPVPNASARVNSKSFSFVAFPNNPKATVRVTCHARLNNKTMSGSFSYYYPQSSHYDHPEGYNRVIELYANDKNNTFFRSFSGRDSVDLDLGFAPGYTSYTYRFDGVYRGQLEL